MRGPHGPLGYCVLFFAETRVRYRCTFRLDRDLEAVEGRLESELVALPGVDFSEGDGDFPGSELPDVIEGPSVL